MVINHLLSGMILQVEGPFGVRKGLVIVSTVNRGLGMFRGIRRMEMESEIHATC